MTSKSPKIFQLSAAAILLTLVAWLGSANVGWANWTPPNAPPPACVSGDPGCAQPINISATGQIKAGSLGISNVLAVFGNAYAKKLGVGPGFFDSTVTLDSDPNVALHVDGDLRLKFGAPNVGDVLVAADTGGLLGWEDIDDEMLWTRVAPPGDTNDIYNTDGGAVGVRTGDILLNDGLTVKGALVRFNNTFGSMAGNVETQVNLGENSHTAGQYSTVAGGTVGRAEGNYSFVGGGEGNNATGDYDAIAGGVASGASLNTAAGGGYNFIGGGDNLDIWGQYNVVLGGLDSQIGSSAISRANYSVVGGGEGTNRVYSDYGVVVGGQANQLANVGATHSVIGGGASNQIESTHSVIPGGENNEIGLSSNYSFAGGKDATVLGSTPGTFVWGGENGATVATPNAFIIHPGAGPLEGYVGIGTANPTAKLDVNGNVRIRGSSAFPPAAGYVLTSASNSGDAYWAAPPAVTPPPPPGEGTMYVYKSGAPDPTCPTAGLGGVTWSATTVWTESIGGQTNRVIACYTNANVQVLRLVGVSCPGAWTAWPQSGYYTVNSGTFQNNVRLCFKLNP